MAENGKQNRSLVGWSAGLLALQGVVLFLFVNFCVHCEMTFLPFGIIVFLLFIPFYGSVACNIVSIVRKRKKGTGIMTLLHVLFVLAFLGFLFFAYALGRAYAGG